MEERANLICYLCDLSDAVSEERVVGYCESLNEALVFLRLASIQQSSPMAFSPLRERLLHTSMTRAYLKPKEQMGCECSTSHTLNSKY